MEFIDQQKKEEIAKKVEKLKNNSFKQLSIPNWRPVNTIQSTMLVFGFFAVVFIGCGALLYHSSDGIF